MEHNLNKRVADSENVSLECDGSDWSASVMVDFLDEDNAEMLADRELRRLYAAMSRLTERQTEVIQLYFYKGMTLQEIAEELGITKPAVHYAMKGAPKKLEKVFDELLNFCPKTVVFMRGPPFKYIDSRKNL